MLKLLNIIFLEKRKIFVKYKLLIQVQLFFLAKRTLAFCVKVKQCMLMEPFDIVQIFFTIIHLT